ncbi:MAG: Bifunctional NAD(P)H-hydrate repair enzyme [Acidobacteria bacterium]|nr:Bifunctional NAD(P)H-hydrate repair enzyme [Acidobacteriota bacterium]
MQKILTTEEMREVDRLTTEKYGVPSILLMENAAHAAARVITAKLGGSMLDKTVLVLCGKGNNGGDGAALARILWTLGADVEVCLIGKVEETSGDARTNFEILQKISDKEGFELDQSDLVFEEIDSLEEWLEYDSLNFHSEDPDVLVDALFGTGLTRPLDEIHEQVAAFMFAFNIENVDQETLVVSLDVPSGLSADASGKCCVTPCAHVTVTFTAPKIANVLPPAANYNGELFVANIGSPCELINNSPSQTFLADIKDAHDWLIKTKFTSASYKNKRGHALVVGGAKNYAGAAILSGNAAIVSGVGLATVAAPESVHNAIASRMLPEVMTRSVAETPNGAISREAVEEILDFIEGKIDAVAVGSGMSSSEESTRQFAREFVEKRKTPVVIDADALNSLAPFDLQGSHEFPLILTPHEGEFLKLIGSEDKESIKDRVKAARDFAEKHRVILVLKGERSLVAAPDGRVVVNPTGNSGLGKAGNGDTLVGIIVGFVAQAVQMKVDVFESVVAAIFIAGYAADIAERKYGKRSMLATDVRECLMEAFEEIGRVNI